MIITRYLYLPAALAILLAAAPASAASQARIVSLGGTLTEIVCALGAADSLVGVDQSSYYPPSVTDLPHLNYHRNISAEGILSLAPTLVLHTAEAGPPAALSQLRDTGINLVQIGGDDSTTGTAVRIQQVADAIGHPDAARALIESLQADLDRLQAFTDQLQSRPRVLFIYARGAGTLMAAGAGTSAETAITLAGGTNAATGFEGFKPLTAEAVVTAAPDVILLLDRGLDSLGGIDGLLAIPGVAQTPAAAHRRFIAMDDLYLLGFGPRLGQALLDLARALHPDSAPTLAETTAP